MPKRRARPLTNEQSDRAARFANLPRTIASELCRRRPRRFDDAVSIGHEVLCQVAKTFDPSKSPQGEGGFGPYAVKWMRRKVRALMQREFRRAVELITPKLADSLTAAHGKLHVGAVPGRYHACPNDATPEAVSDLYEAMREGLGLRDVAAQAGVTLSSVYRWKGMIERLGVTYVP